MAKSAMDLNLGATTPYGSETGAGRLVRSRHCRFCQLERWNRAHTKIKEMHWALALGDRLFGILNNNQPNSRQNW